MNRKQRRAAAKNAKKEGDEELSEKIGLFNKLPDECLVCLAPFDKKNKEMVKSWSVIVREEQKKVRLYCPDCWGNAAAIRKDFKDRIEERNNEDKAND